MNFADNEVVAAILSDEGYQTVGEPQDADLILLNTAPYAKKAEQTVRNRLEAPKNLQEK